ncbi:hypothetical protein BJF85_20035 [Saccharomonospora sp. CUA-673]|uniref:hypothetical protein n=1 Tax=Saccharomonospora sp. CUA-673 TaxID=1904969 RepID=UPI00096055A4|nr:hypothetical protein [Saccharomonospora sp. CUA-673]OLT44596.1 hypothetical protein BJF85_20035 [Saccharomonospora sp. CUA-673]
MRVPPPQTGAAPDAADYASAFRVPTPAARTRSPREWTRLVFEGAPTPLAVLVAIPYLLRRAVRRTERE